MLVPVLVPWELPLPNHGQVGEGFNCFGDSNSRWGPVDLWLRLTVWLSETFRRRDISPNPTVLFLLSSAQFSHASSIHHVVQLQARGQYALGWPLYRYGTRDSHVCFTSPMAKAVFRHWQGTKG